MDEVRRGHSLHEASCPLSDPDPTLDVTKVKCTCARTGREPDEEIIDYEKIAENFLESELPTHGLGDPDITALCNMVADLDQRLLNAGADFVGERKEAVMHLYLVAHNLGILPRRAKFVIGLRNRGFLSGETSVSS